MEVTLLASRSSFCTKVPGSILVLAKMSVFTKAHSYKGKKEDHVRLATWLLGEMQSPSKGWETPGRSPQAAQGLAQLPLEEDLGNLSSLPSRGARDPQLPLAPLLTPAALSRFTSLPPPQHCRSQVCFQPALFPTSGFRTLHVTLRITRAHPGPTSHALPAHSRAKLLHRCLGRNFSTHPQESHTPTDRKRMARKLA